MKEDKPNNSVLCKVEFRDPEGFVWVFEAYISKDVEDTEENKE